MNSKFSHLCLLSAVIRRVYHHPLLSKIPQNTAAYYFKILVHMSQNGGCHLQISAGYAIIANFRITMSGGGVAAPSLPGSYFGTWLKERSHLKFMVTVAETKNKDID